MKSSFCLLPIHRRRETLFRCESRLRNAARSSLPRKYEGVNDSQHGIDGVRIGRLANPATSPGRLPFGAKVSALQCPPAIMLLHANVSVRVCERMRGNLDIKLDFRFAGEMHISCITILEHREESMVGGIHADGHSSNRDDQAKTLGFWGQCFQMNSRILEMNLTAATGRGRFLRLVQQCPTSGPELRLLAPKPAWSCAVRCIYRFSKRKKLFLRVCPAQTRLSTGWLDWPNFTLSICASNRRHWAKKPNAQTLRRVQHCTAREDSARRDLFFECNGAFAFSLLPRTIVRTLLIATSSRAAFVSRTYGGLAKFLDGYEIAGNMDLGVHESVLTLEEIANLAAEGGQAAETLMNLVALIAKRFRTDVCSAYLLEPDRANLVLAATVGLRRECIGSLRMAVN